MINGIKEKRIRENLNLYMINSTKFKTDLLGVYIKRPLNKEEAAKNTLLTRMLLRSTMKHKTTKELSVYLEEAYGTILVSDVIKYGETHVLQFKLQFPNKKHILDKEIFEESMNLLNEIIFEPHIIDGQFNNEYFEQEKINLIDEIRSREDDKMSYALERCIETMYEGEPYSLYMYGEEEDVLKITNEELYTHYLDIIKSSLVDICVIGDVDFKEVEEIVTTKFDIESGKLEYYPAIKIHKRIYEIQKVEEKHSIQQGKLVLGYRTNIHHKNELYEAAVLAYNILGGGANSKLFVNIREKESLCYFIFAKADKFKGCMLIGAGIEFADYDKAVELITEEVNKLKAGEFDDELIKIAKDAMVSSFRSVSDFPNSFTNFYYTEILGRSNLDETFNIEEMIEKYNSVTKEDIVNALNMLELDTIYFMDGEENEDM